jgi:hypothetical protein
MKKQCRLKILKKTSDGYNLLEDVESRKAHDIVEIKIAEGVPFKDHTIELRIEALATNEINVYSIRDDLEIVQTNIYSHRLSYELRMKTVKQD